MLLRNLHDRFGGDRLISRAAFLVQKTEHFTQCIRVRRVPKKRSRTAHIHQPHLPQFFQMMRKGGRRNAQILLNLSRHHARGVRGEQQAHDLQARLGADGGKTVGAASDQQGIGFLHISMIAEIWKQRNPFFPETPCSRLASYFCGTLFFETPAFFAFDRVSHAWDTEKTNFMNLNRLFLAALCASLTALPSHAQMAPATLPAVPESQKVSARADAYYNFTMGHIFEQQFEQTGAGEYATRAIESYKKAYALDPQSPIIGERLAEMYWKAQRQHDAIAEANQILKNNPDDLATHRLLALVYLRSLGDINGSNVQGETINKAIEEYSAVHRLDPSDQESTIWLARLYRLHNEPDKAEEVLRGLLKDDPENDAGVEQLTQLLLDQNKSEEAIQLLNGLIDRSPSATLYDHLGDAYTQTHDFAKAEAAYRKAVDLDPSELSHLRGLGQTLLSEEKYTEALSVYQKLSELLPDDADTYLRIAQIYRELHQLDKAEENLVKARQFAPGSLEVMYNEAMIYESQGRFDDAIRVLSDAVTGVKAQSRGHAVAPAFAGDSLSTVGHALSRHAELYCCDLHLPGTRSFGR